jgi:hypothetical protein
MNQREIDEYIPERPLNANALRGSIRRVSPRRDPILVWIVWSLLLWTLSLYAAVNYIESHRVAPVVGLGECHGAHDCVEAIR